MEVTVDNFARALEILQSKIESADLIAIDGEFTGLSTFREKAPGYDSMDEVYEKQRSGTGKMLLVQYGVCLFIWKEDLEEYEAVPFSFYIFPRPYKNWGNDIIFTAQSSSMNFLAENGFDFNKLFHKGVSFMNPREEQMAQKNIDREIELMTEKEKESAAKCPDPESEENASKVFIPKDQRELIDNICHMVNTFVKEGSDDPLDLPPCTPFQRKLIYEKVEELYPLGLYLEAVANATEDKFIRVHKTLAGYKKNLEQKMETEKQQLDDKVGFLKVIRLLTKSKKPIIGHNMFKDLLLTHSNFFGNLPWTLAEFKSSLHDLFPIIFDTKVLATVPPASNTLSHSSVERLVKDVNEGNLPDPCTRVSADLKDEDGYSERFHDAGYDALSTGRIFISLSKHISHNDGAWVKRIDVSSEVINKFANRIYINRIKDVFSCNLCGGDVTPDRRNVFHMVYPPGWKTPDIKDLFSPYSSVWVNWINETSAFVTVDEDHKYDEIVKNLVTGFAGEGVSVTPYSHYIRRMDPRRKQEDEEDRVSEVPEEAPPTKRKRTESSSKKEDMEDGEIDSDGD